MQCTDNNQAARLAAAAVGNQLPNLAEMCSLAKTANVRERVETTLDEKYGRFYAVSFSGELNKFKIS